MSAVWKCKSRAVTTCPAPGVRTCVSAGAAAELRRIAFARAKASMHDLRRSADTMR